MTTLPTLNGWVAKRAGAAITITHETGKITGIVHIYSVIEAGRPVLLAIRDTGERFELVGASV